MELTLFVYRDEGVGTFSYKALMRSLKKVSLPSNLKIKTIDAVGIIEGSWREECQLLIFPGGRDIPYHERLQGKGAQEIRTFVEQGGRYLGICAGAYFASKEVVFERDTPNELSGERELCFFPGKAEGTLAHLGPYSYEGHESAYPHPITYKDKTIYVYYNGGCFFHKAEEYPSVKVLSYYEIGEKRSSAIIECTVGEGKAILSGVHIEVEAELCKNEPSLYSQLLETEKERNRFFEELLNKLLS